MFPFCWEYLWVIGFVPEVQAFWELLRLRERDRVSEHARHNEETIRFNSCLISDVQLFCLWKGDRYPEGTARWEDVIIHHVPCFSGYALTRSAVVWDHRQAVYLGNNAAEVKLRAPEWAQKEKERQRTWCRHQQGSVVGCRAPWC